MTKHWAREEILDAARSFQAAAVITAAADLGVFTALEEGGKTAGQVAESCGADVRAMTILLDALAAMQLLTKAAHRYATAPGVAAVLAEGGHDSAAAMVRHLGNSMRRWAQLAAVVKTGLPAERGPSIRGPEADLASFIGGMDDLTRSGALKLVRQLGPPAFRHLLDVGGASGTYTIAFLQAAPAATATLFDLPDVIPLARLRIAEAHLADRVTLAAGDLTADDLPAGADLAWVSAIIHMNSRAENRALFGKLFAALAGGGRVLVRDVFMDAGRTQPTGGALFAVNMLVATAGGGTYTFDEVRADLEAAGFAGVELARRRETMDSVVAAVKPG